MSGRRVPTRAPLAAAATILLVCACGGPAPRVTAERVAVFPVQVTRSTFPAAQRLAQRTALVIAVRNVGRARIPNIALTLSGPGRTSAAVPFGISNLGSASPGHSGPVWILDRPPGPCRGRSGYSCLDGGPGGAVTSSRNTWALGALAPGATAVFIWGLTPVRPGHYQLTYDVAPGLGGTAAARLPGGAIPRQTFRVAISGRPAGSYVDGAGRIIRSG